MSEQMDTLLARMGYIRRDHAAAGQELELHAKPAAADPDRAAYPQVVMIQGRHSAGESWIRDHAGQLMLAAGVCVVGLAALAVVALVALVTAVALIGIATSLAVIKGVAASQAPTERRGWRR
jgi:hypothetical protein